jgi:2-amino-4-hydroxy-6-hydroxymethyldihydropteridine diphosphokinase
MIERSQDWRQACGSIAARQSQRQNEESIGRLPSCTMPSRIGLLGLGSNMGERRAHLQGAVDALEKVGVRVLASSSVYDTDPVGEVLDQASFLNACLRIQTDLEPLLLLDLAKRVELELGRTAQGLQYARHGPRAIDIDVLLLGDLQLREERMSLPHEQVLARRFVLIPALELDLDLTVPDGRRLADALVTLPLSEGVCWAGPPLEVHGS